MKKNCSEWILAAFWEKKIRRQSGVSSVLRSKTLAQAEFTSAEQVKRQTASQPHEKKIPLMGLAC